MSKIWLNGFALLSVLFLANASGINASQPKQNASEALTGTLQKMIVENASVTMQLDLNGLNGSNSLVARPVTVQFDVAANSFFPIVVFNDLLRADEPGSMALIPQNVPTLPAHLAASLKQLVIEKRRSNQVSIWQCAMARPSSRFLMLKGPITITTPTHVRLALQMADSLFRNSLPTRSVAHRTRAQ